MHTSYPKLAAVALLVTVSLPAQPVAVEYADPGAKQYNSANESNEPAAQPWVSELNQTRQQQQAALENGQLSSYLLGAGDEITIYALSAEEVSNKAIGIGPSGYINLPLIGRIRATGLTVEDLEKELNQRLGEYVQDPQVAVVVTEYASKPVSVIGSVNRPGVHQLQRPLTLVETLSLAGGLSQNAGPTVKITRRQEWGPLPFADSRSDASGQFSIAELNLTEIMEAESPEKNILVQPHDVITVPKADAVYIMGAVQNPGEYILNNREDLTILTALSLAGGVDNRRATAKNVRILRLGSESTERTEIAVNVKHILEGREKDVLLRSDDILFIPDSRSKKIMAKFIEAAVRIGQYATYRRLY